MKCDNECIIIRYDLRISNYQFQNKIREILLGSNIEKKAFIITDLTKRESVSKEVVEEIVVTAQKLHLYGADLIIANISQSCLKFFQSMKLHFNVRYYEDLNSALQAYLLYNKTYTENITMHFPAQLEYVPIIRKFIRSIVEYLHYSHSRVFKIEAIVDEICNNAIEHGSGSIEEEISLSMVSAFEKINLAISNSYHCNQKDSLKNIFRNISTTSIHDENPRGRGITIVKQISDNFEVETNDRGTCVKITILKE